MLGSCLAERAALVWLGGVWGEECLLRGEPRMYLASTSPGPARHQWQASAVPPTRPILPMSVYFRAAR